MQKSFKARQCRTLKPPVCVFSRLIRKLNVVFSPQAPDPVLTSSSDIDRYSFP